MRYLVTFVLSGVAWAQAPALEDEPGVVDEPETEADQPDEPLVPVVNTAIALPDQVLGLGVRFRYITIPHFLLQAFADESTQLNSYAIAGEFTWWRRERYALVTSLEFAAYDADDGNFLGNGQNPEQKTDYIQFRNLNMLSLDATFVWDHDFTPKVALVWGVGVGVMFPLGDVFRASSEGCTADNAGDETQCRPQGCDNGICTVPDIDALTALDDPFKDDRGAAFEQDLWPVYPLLNLLVGVRFQLHRHFQARVDGGFHNAFFLGAAGSYLF